MKGVSTLSRAVTAAQERNPNPFVCLRVGDQLQLARVVRKTIAPVWGQVFNFQAQGENELLLEVWDKTIIGKPTFLGQAVINLAVIKPNVDERLWVELTDRAPTTGDTRSTTRADGASSPSGEEEDIYSSSNGQGSGAGMSVWGRSAQKAARSFRGELELVIHLLQGKHSRGLSVESVELPSDRPSV
jgi:Ca2+-dependent lipid-binding protein